jgi:MATE family multidrug resistance protein
MAKDSRQKLVSEEKNSEILDEEQELQIEINHSQSRFQKILARLKDKLASEVLELKALINLAAPLTATYIALGLLQMTNLFFVGRLGKKEYLAGAALGSTYCNVFGFAIGVGILTASDTLSSQAYGAGNFKRVGIILQRSILISGLFAVPVILLFWFADKILLALKQDPEVVTIAGIFTR